MLLFACLKQAFSVDFSSVFAVLSSRKARAKAKVVEKVESHPDSTDPVRFPRDTALHEKDRQL